MSATERTSIETPEEPERKSRPGPKPKCLVIPPDAAEEVLDRLLGSGSQKSKRGLGRT